MMLIVLMVLVFLASIIACHSIAKRRSANPVFWGLMGALLGPLAIPFAFMSRPKAED